MAITAVGGLGRTAVARIAFASTFKRRYRDSALITKLTNTEFKGKFKGSGEEIDVPCLPIMRTNRRIKGETIKYQTPEAWIEKFTIGRERDFAFAVKDEDVLLSYLDLKGEYLKEAQNQHGTDVDAEFLSDVPFKAHMKNMGNAAGYRSGAYKLGSATSPVYVYEDKADAAADSTSGRVKATVKKLLTSMVSVLGEQPGGAETKPFIVIPHVLANLMQNSQLSHADAMGDQMSIARKSVQYLGEISGASILVCNELPKFEAETIGAAQLPDRFTCFFGDPSAVTFADEIVVPEELRSTSAYETLFRQLAIYDWFVRYPERIGSAIVAIG